MDKDLFEKYQRMRFDFVEIDEDKKPLRKRVIDEVVNWDKNKIYGVIPPKNMAIVDVDVKKGSKGLESFEKLVKTLGCKLKANVKTQSGGYHYYCWFKGIPPRQIQKNYPGIDFICRKEENISGYCVAGGQTLKGEYKFLGMHTNTIEFDDTFQFQFVTDLDISASDLYPKLTQDDVKNCLKWISCDDYLEWIADGAAIKSILGESGLDIFVEWSKKSDKFESREDCVRKWKSFRSDYQNGRSGGTLIQKALESKFALFCEQLKRIDFLEDLAQLTSASIWKEFPKFNSKIINNEISKIVISHSNHFKEKPKRGEIQKYINFLSGKDFDDVNEFEIENLKFNNFVKVNSFTKNQFYQLDNGAKHDEITMNCILREQLSVITKELGLNKALTIQQAFKMGLIPYVSDHEYNPRINERIYRDNNGKLILNLFDSASLPKSSEETVYGNELIRKFLKHLDLLLGKDCAKTFLDFLAYITQNPGFKVLWAPLIQGVEGVGKSLIGNIMINHVFGEEHSGIVDAVLIGEKNNSWATSKMLRILEEIKISGFNRYEILNHLKPIITNPKITRMEKFEVSKEVLNVCNFIAFTNYKDALPVNNTDRRWWVVFSPIQSIEEIEEKTRISRDSYFAPLHELASPDSPYGGEFKRFLMGYQISKSFNPNFPPRSKFKDEIVLFERMKFELLEDVEELLFFTYQIKEPPVVNIGKLLENSIFATDKFGTKIFDKKLKRSDLRTVMKKLDYEIFDANNKDIYYKPSKIKRNDVKIEEIGMFENIDIEDLI